MDGCFIRRKDSGSQQEPGMSLPDPPLTFWKDILNVCHISDLLICCILLHIGVPATANLVKLLLCF